MALTPQCPHHGDEAYLEPPPQLISPDLKMDRQVVCEKKEKKGTKLAHRTTNEAKPQQVLQRASIEANVNGHT